MTGQNRNFYGEIGTEPPAKDCECYEHKGNGDNSNKSAGDAVRSITIWYRGWSWKVRLQQ